MKLRYWLAGAALAGGAYWRLRRRQPRQTPQTFHLDLGPGRGDLESETPGSVQFIGTATTIIRYGGLTILTDPNFLHRGEKIHVGYGIHATRLTDPAIEFDELPRIDFVVLSHLHEDHFDRLVEARLPRDTPILTTAEAAHALRGKGFRRSFALRTWDKVEISKGDSRLRLTSLPGRHGPLVVSAAMPAVMGSMLEFRGHPRLPSYRMYISGDTLVYDELKQIPARYPGIDLALLHLGGTRVMGILVTMNAEQGIEALRFIRPETAIPVHYDDYDLFREPLGEFMRAVERAGMEDRVRYLERGQTYSFAPAQTPARPIPDF